MDPMLDAVSTIFFISAVVALFAGALSVYSVVISSFSTNQNYKDAAQIFARICAGAFAVALLMSAIVGLPIIIGFITQG